MFSKLFRNDERQAPLPSERKPPAPAPPPSNPAAPPVSTNSGRFNGLSAAVQKQIKPEASAAGKVNILAAESINELPPFVELMTAPRGPIGIGDMHRATIAVVRDAENKVWIVCEGQMRGTTLVSTLIQKISRTHTFAGIVQTSALVVGEIYRNSLRSQDKSSDKPIAAVGPTSNNEAVFLEIIRAADSMGASDVHIEVRDKANPPSAIIKFRHHGELKEHQSYEPGILRTIVSTIYNGNLVDPKSRSAGHGLWSDEHSCSCAVLIQDLNGSKAKLRWQQTLENRGFDVVLRILSAKGGVKPKTLAELGYASNHITHLGLASRSSVGLIILAGTTGSGKSTTVTSMLMHRPDLGRVKIVTLEDPVENDLQHATQIPIQRSLTDVNDNAFAEAMAVAMRLDPDIVMPGEMRDPAAGQMVQAMVQSGHKVYSTIHVASAFEIPGRMCSDMIKLSRAVMCARNFFSAMVYQKLVALLCKHCKLPAKGNIDDALRKLLVGKYRLDLDRIFIRNEEGCPHCSGGIVGRSVCAEVVLPDAEILDMIKQGDDPGAEKYWRRTRVAPFDHEDCTGKLAMEHAIYKMSQGLVCPHEVEAQFVPFESHHIVTSEKASRAISLVGNGPAN